MIALLDDNLYVRIFPGKGLELGEQKGASVRGRRPAIAVLEDELADLGNERGVAVGGERPQLCSQQRHERKERSLNPSHLSIF